MTALYTFNVNIDTIGELSRRITLSKVTTFKLNNTGFFSTNSLKELVLEYLGDVNIEDAKIPLAMVATDINNGEEVILTSGSVPRQLFRASISQWLLATELSLTVA